MKIENVLTEDIAAVLELQKRCYLENGMRYNDLSIPPLCQTPDELKSELDTGAILKVTSKGIIVGSIRAHCKEDTCYIGKLIVHPEYQNQGIGTELLHSIERYFFRVGRFELFTGNKDEKNLYLYKKHGYKEFKQVEISNDLVLIFMEKKNKPR